VTKTQRPPKCQWSGEIVVPESRDFCHRAQRRPPRAGRTRVQCGTAFVRLVSLCAVCGSMSDIVGDHGCSAGVLSIGQVAAAVSVCLTCHTSWNNGRRGVLPVAPFACQVQSWPVFSPRTRLAALAMRIAKHGDTNEEGFYGRRCVRCVPVMAQAQSPSPGVYSERSGVTGF